jgi:hypothetical protein
LSVDQGTPLTPGDDCDVYVRAYTDSAIDGTPIAGPYAAPASFHFGGQGTFSNPPSNCTTTVPACAGRLNPVTDVISPGVGTTVGKSPLICWKPADMDSVLEYPQHGYWVDRA